MTEAPSARTSPLIDRITLACIGAGAYTLSVGTMNPAIVLPRLLDALAALNPHAYRELVAPGGPYASIPTGMLADAMNPWWETTGAQGIVQLLVEALNASAPAGFCCVYSDGDRLELARHEPAKPPREPARPAPARRVSTIRRRTLAPEP